MSTTVGLVVVAVLIGANAVFVAAEFAFVAVDRARVEREAAAGDRRATRTLSVVRRLSFQLSGAQLGITISSLILGFVAEPVIATLIEPALEPLVGSGSVGLSIALALVLATGAQMVLGELIPKNLAIATPDPVARRLAGPMWVYGLVFGPLIAFLNGAANWTVARFGIEPTHELSNARSLGELEVLIRSSGEEGVLAPEEATLLTRSIRFRDKTADDAMIPRVEVVALDDDATVADLIALAVESGYSRFPVQRGDLDDIAGVVHTKSAVGVAPGDRAATPVTEVMTDAFVVPESRALSDLLVELRDRGGHLAVVADEYGGTAGIVTLEDLLEEIVGEIDDEHDRPGPVAVPSRPPGAVVVSGAIHRDEIEELTGLVVPEGEYETLAGYLLERLGRIPDEGEWIDQDGWRFQIHLDKHRISRVRVVPPHAGRRSR